MVENVPLSVKVAETSIDELIVQYFHRTRAGKPMWTLNCLVYAGAKTVVATVNDYVRGTGTRTKRLGGFIDNCLRKIRESRTSMK